MALLPPQEIKDEVTKTLNNAARFLNDLGNKALSSQVQTLNEKIESHGNLNRLILPKDDRALLNQLPIDIEHAMAKKQSDRWKSVHDRAKMITSDSKSSQESVNILNQYPKDSDEFKQALHNIQTNLLGFEQTAQSIHQDATISQKLLKEFDGLESATKSVANYLLGKSPAPQR